MEISAHQDKILGVMRRIGSRESERASDAGEDRQEIGDLLELTALNKRAFAFVRMLDKQEPDKREDILRSLTPLLDLFDGVWNGQGTPDLFETAQAPADGGDMEPADDVDEGEVDPELQEDDAEFDAHLAKVAG